MTIIGQGAEAVITRKDDAVIKERIAKEYRLSEIDEKLRKSRTRREAKVLDKLSAINFPAPKLKEMDDKQMSIVMDFVEGPQVKDVLHKDPVAFGKEIGRKVGILHKNEIIHADLTTSNMIHSGEIYFIDFGLSFFSTKVEDMAVDLHLLDRALESKHHEIYEQCIAAVLEGYKETNPTAEQVIKRLETAVQLRGRNKRNSKRQK